MTTPMLACHGGFDPGPGLTTLLLVTLIMWAVALAVTIPNVMMSCRDGKSSRYAAANLGFFAVYVFLGLSLFSGRIFSVNMGISIVLIFLVPLMAIGHFIYLFSGRWRERKAKKLAEMSGGANLAPIPEASGQAAEGKLE